MSRVSGAPRTILVVFPFCLDHVGHGNIQRILAIARDLAANGFDVDLAYQGNPRLAPVDGQYAAFRRVFRVDASARTGDDAAWTRRLTAFYTGYELPQMHMRPSAGLAGLVRGLLDAEPYHAVVATYAFCAPMFSGLGRRVLTVCDVQDILHEHADACARATGQSSSFSLPKATESFLWRQFDVLVAITPEDKARIADHVLPHQDLISARHALGACASAPSPGLDDVALYAGSDNQSNVQAVAWLLENVWPRVRAARASARLRIAGLICNALPAAARAIPGVEVVGFVSDLSSELEQCGVLAAPYLYGSGLKIKVVEAASGGKAIVTTSAGVLGSSLESGRAIEVHDEPDAFADALIALLGDAARRASTAGEALTQARALFSPEACYAPIRLAIRLRALDSAIAPGHGLCPAILDRAKIVVDQVRPQRVVLWGNGSHTRALVPALAGFDIHARLIIDGRATEPSVSPEDLPVAPVADFALVPGDLVILSSETFEREMWRDLASYRDAGGHVLGLFDSRHVSRELVDRLSPQQRAQLAAPANAPREGQPAVVLWDGAPTHEAWWRLCLLRDLAAAAPRFGARAVIVTPSHMGQDRELAGLSSESVLAPVLEIEGRRLEEQSLDGGARGLARAADLMAMSTAHAVSFTQLGRHDVLVVIDPSLSECLGLARTLRARGGRQCPAVVMLGGGQTNGSLGLSPDDVGAYWRLATSELAEATDGRFTVVAIDGVSAAALQPRLGRPVHVIGQPTDGYTVRAVRDRVRLVCLGHVGVPRVRPLLEGLLAIVSDLAPASAVSIGWRSNQADAPPWADDQWAVGLSSLLGLELLDELAPVEMREAIAGADAVIIMGDGSESWVHVARQHAHASGVPVLAPYDSPDLAVPLRQIFSGNPVETAVKTDSLMQPAPLVLARLLELATGRKPAEFPVFDAPSGASLHPALATENS